MDVWIKRQFDELMDQCQMDQRRDGLMDEWMDEIMHGGIDRCLDGRKVVWMDGQMQSLHQNAQL